MWSRNLIVVTLSWFALHSYVSKRKNDQKTLKQSKKWSHFECSWAPFSHLGAWQVKPTWLGFCPIFITGIFVACRTQRDELYFLFNGIKDITYTIANRTKYINGNMCLILAIKLCPSFILQTEMTGPNFCGFLHLRSTLRYFAQNKPLLCTH